MYKLSFFIGESPQNNSITKVNFFVIGGLNIKVMDIVPNPGTYGAYGPTKHYDYGQMWSINSPTRVPSHTSTAIDNVVTKLADTSASVLDVVISHHYGQLATVPECALGVEQN